MADLSEIRLWQKPRRDRLLDFEVRGLSDCLALAMLEHDWHLSDQNHASESHLGYDLGSWVVEF